jgi:mycofactocin system glycosyltransferase
MLAGGTVLTGGYPTRVLRLTPAGGRHVEGWWSGAPVPDNPKARALARRLLDTGIAHPARKRRVGDQDAGDQRASDQDASHQDASHQDASHQDAGEVTVVIPVRDRPAELARCLAGLAKMPRVIVVDDGSRDPEAVARAAAEAGASMLRRPQNGGPAAARNTGLAAADTPLVAFLDSDCVPRPGWLDVLLPHFADPAVGAVAPRIVPHENGRTWLARYEGVSSTLDMGARPSIVRPGSRVPYVPGAALVVRKTAAGAGFAEDMQVGEDVDFVWRLAAAGWRTRYEPAATMGHQHRVRLRAWLARRKDYGTSAAALEQRHPGAVRPLYASPWTAAAWLAVAAGRPAAAAAVTGAATALLARRLARVTGEGWPRPAGSSAWRLAAQQAGGGTIQAALPLGSAISRTWWPVALPVTVAVRRLRLPVAALVLAPPLLDWLDRRPPLDPARYVTARLLDDIGYSLGVWQGCAARRTVRPLLPLLRGRPQERRRLAGHHLCRPRLNSAGTRMSSGDRSWMEARPSASRVESMPARSTSNTFFTPAEPLAASPHR